MATDEVDRLFEVKNSLYIGNYMHCINKAKEIKPRDDAERADCDALMYRAYLCHRKYPFITFQLRNAVAPQLQAIKLLAEFLEDPNKNSAVVSQMESLLSSSSLDPGAVTVAIAAAIVYCNMDNYEGALRALNQHDTLECRATMVHCYLAMHRLDAARKELKSMQEKDDDATLTQLAQAWVHIASGGEKLQDAYYIYQELMDKYCRTPALLTGQAACFLGQGKTDEASSVLHEAEEDDANYTEAFVNLLVLSHHTNSPQSVIASYLGMLNNQQYKHDVVHYLAGKEDEFDRIVKQYAPSTA